MLVSTLHALMVYAINRDALDEPFTRVLNQFKSDADHMHMSIDDFAFVVLHDAAQDIKLGHSYGSYNHIIAMYYNID